MAQIALTKGKFAIVDDEDLERLKPIKWYTQISNGAKGRPKYYACRSVYTNGKRQAVGMPYEVLMAKKVKGRVCDHINGDSLDNRKANLRFCTQRDNAHNYKRRDQVKPKTSKYVGVYKHGPTQKYMARIRFNNKLIYLGYFADEVDAARAYDRAVNKMFGEFGRPNFKS